MIASFACGYTGAPAMQESWLFPFEMIIIGIGDQLFPFC
jgi:hypothetical protein